MMNREPREIVMALMELTLLYILVSRNYRPNPIRVQPPDQLAPSRAIRTSHPSDFYKDRALA
jgi:hypothetical protein